MPFLPSADEPFLQFPVPNLWWLPTFPGPPIGTGTRCFDNPDDPNCRVQDRPTFGPIAGPVNIPPLFGPMSSPEVPTMPFDLGPNLTGLAAGVLGGLFGARRATQGFIPQTTTTGVGVSFPGTGMPPEIFAPRTTLSGQVINKGCDCVIQRNLPARVVNYKGRAVFNAQGQVVGCTPRRRQMNPGNARAATRAARTT
jgi:hypothetical protein